MDSSAGAAVPTRTHSALGPPVKWQAFTAVTIRPSWSRGRSGHGVVVAPAEYGRDLRRSLDQFMPLSNEPPVKTARPVRNIRCLP
ncbi:hypothetical protein GXW83_23865 [Streptacidiphilus sp. PB12-B1b]|nr:hypothetical protein GXW83_23865 [Streptacidiphilus sp. PB12-B1b]